MSIGRVAIKFKPPIFVHRNRQRYSTLPPTEVKLPRVWSVVGWVSRDNIFLYYSLPFFYYDN